MYAGVCDDERVCNIYNERAYARPRIYARGKDVTLLRIGVLLTLIFSITALLEIISRKLIILILATTVGSSSQGHVSRIDI